MSICLKTPNTLKTHGISEFFRPGQATAAQSSSASDRCTLHVHTDVETLRENGEGAESTLENGGNVSAETCVPDWDGEPMDDDLVVERLYQMESAGTG